ncbi:unnamed protein product [Acanthocheilonema viteae]|uniref:Uncharacterized protein n=1 Tax=Acanthocheilonema viteae TaxID=6277 RepID=A0A498SSN7_ACAVI|nr:unnamed protein product [Acanthocheilonema viteae]
MGIIRNGCCAIKSFISAVIEWRSAATAPYFMFINSAFWWSVFYLDKGTQLRLLVSFAAGIFSWDILLSSTYDRSILFHILTWPIRSVLRTISVVMALCSAQFLYRIEFEKACWTAYSAAILEKVKKELLRMKAAVRSAYVATVTKLYAGMNAMLDATNSILFNIENFISHIVYELKNDTDTELADLLPPGFANGEESDNDETSDKPSLPSRSHSPLTEDERDFVRGLKFPNLDTSDSSEAEFALKPKSKSQKVLRKKSKAHPKDPAPSACNDELISKEQKVGKNKQRSSSTSSHSESVISSSAQNASDDAELQNLDALDFESDDRSQTEFLENTVEIQKLKDSRDRRSKNRKQNTNQEEVEEIEVCGTEQINVNSVAFVDSLDGSFEVLDK